MIKGLCVLLFFHLLGEFIAVACSLPIPGAIIGLLLLLCVLLVSGGVPEPLQVASRGLVPLLPVLLLPPAVGVLLYWQLLANSFWSSIAALAMSVVISLAFIAFLMKCIWHRTK